MNISCTFRGDGQLRVHLRAESVPERRLLDLLPAALTRLPGAANGDEIVFVATPERPEGGR